jgi:hypothetical protein
MGLVQILIHWHTRAQNAMGPNAMGPVIKQSLIVKSQQQMGPQGHKPIKRITQFLGFYWEQSLMQKSQNHTDGPTKPISPSKG